MKTDEIFDLLKIPEEIANKAYIYELKDKLQTQERLNRQLSEKAEKLKNCIKVQGVALRRRNVQIKELKDELFIQSQFLDEKYKV
jgi:hypothetical protein